MSQINLSALLATAAEEAAPDLGIRDAADLLRRLDPATRPTLGIAAAAEWLCTTERHIRYLVSSGRLGHARIGRHLRFTPAELTRYLDAHTYPATVAGPVAS